MTNIIRIPGNTQAYLELVHDGLQDVHLVKSMQYRYQNTEEETMPNPIGNWPMDDAENNLRTDTVGGRNLEEWYSSVPSTVGKISNCAVLSAAWEALIWDDTDPPYSQNGPFPLGATKMTLAVWMKRGGNETGNLVCNIVDNNPSGVTNFGFYWTASGLIARISSALLPDTPSYTIDFGVVSYDWHLCIIWWDEDVGVLYAQVDNGVAQSIPANHASLTWTDPIHIVQASKADPQTLTNGGWVDQMTLYNVILTDDQRSYLWNDGNGRALA